mmetsp:Transcript_30688/g.67401  ORF Transcript_30688/g.67401 Transcript_30688/m.67401 type:complete len:211 (+) Transcript_30688:102-734(+)
MDLYDDDEHEEGASVTSTSDDDTDTDAANGSRSGRRSNSAGGGLDLSDVPENLSLITSSRSASGYRGVAKNGSRWQASIRVGKKCVKALGTFDTPEEAAAIYAKAVFKYNLPVRSTGASQESYGGLDLSDVPDNLSLIPNPSSASGYRGVAKNGTRWQAKIPIGKGGVKALGTFDTPEEAAAIFAKAAFKYKLPTKRLPRKRKHTATATI